jgi:hypothetical protein
MVVTRLKGTKETELPDPSIEWIEETCPYCGRKYRYIRNSLYQPKTCSDYQCVRRSLHPDLFHGSSVN